MDFKSFLIGFVSGIFLFGFAYWLFAPYFNRLTISRGIVPPTMKPYKFKSIVSLQQLIKSLIRQGDDKSELYIQSSNPKFLIRIYKHCYKTKKDKIIFDIRNSDYNRTSYPSVLEELKKNNVDFNEHFTPRTHVSKDIKIDVEIGELAPAEIGAIIHVIFLAVSADAEKELYASENPPQFWKIP